MSDIKLGRSGPPPSREDYDLIKRPDIEFKTVDKNRIKPVYRTFRIIPANGGSAADHSDDKILRAVAADKDSYQAAENQLNVALRAGHQGSYTILPVYSSPF